MTLLPAALGGPTIVYDVIECRSCKLEGCLCINGSEALTAAAPMDPPWMGIARPLNSSDPYLLTWEKDPQNPINFTGGPQTGGANPGSLWWNEQLEHFNLLALSHGGAEGGTAVTALAPEVGTMGKMYRYETRDRTFHNWTRQEVFSSHSGNGGQWFMGLPRTVDGTPAPAGSPTHILTSGDGGAFAFGDYHEANDSWVPAPAEWSVSNTASGPDSAWMATQNASGRVLNVGWATVCGGASALTILRELKYDVAHKALVSNPVEELEQLRTSSLANMTAPISIPAGGSSEIPGTAHNDAAASSDVLITFELPADGSAVAFGACVLASSGPRGGGLGQPEVGGPWRPGGLCGDAANSSGVPVLANLSAVDPEDGTRSGTVSIGVQRLPHPVFITIYKDETEFDMRILVDRCIVEAFVMGGRHAFTSMGPQDAHEAGKNPVPSVPGTAMLLMAETAITVKSAQVYSMGCGWTDPPYIGEGPFTVDGRTVEY